MRFLQEAEEEADEEEEEEEEKPKPKAKKAAAKKEVSAEPCLRLRRMTACGSALL